MASSLKEFCLRWNNHHSTLVSVLDSLLERETFVDVMLAAEGQFIKVHRVVLCACSQYFEDLISQQTDKQAIVFLKDVTFTDLRALVDYMYRGEVNVSQDQLTTFLQTAEALKIRGLADNDRVRSPPSSHSAESLPKRARTAREEAPPPPPQLHHRPAQPAQTIVPSMPQQQMMPSVPVESARTVADVDSAASGDVTEMPWSGDHAGASHMSSHSESDDHFIALEPKVEGIETELSDEDGGQGNSSMWIERESMQEWSDSGAYNETAPAEMQTHYQDNRQRSNSTDQIDPSFLAADNLAGPSNASRPGGGGGDDSAATSRRGGIEVDTGEWFKCPKCTRLYKSKKAMDWHLRNACGVSPRFACTVPNCSYRAHYRHNLKNHLTRKHNIVSSPTPAKPRKRSSTAPCQTPRPDNP